MTMKVAGEIRQLLVSPCKMLVLPGLCHTIYTYSKTTGNVVHTVTIVGAVYSNLTI